MTNPSDLKSLDLCGPDPRPITKAEGLAIAEIMQLLPPAPVVVQIGAYWGISTAVMLEARPDALIFSIDVNPCEAEQETLVNLGLPYRRAIRVLGKSFDIGMEWPYTCDLLFVDGDHTYMGVMDDCTAWLGQVRGYVLFHDYIPFHARSKVSEVVDSLFNKAPIIGGDSLIGFEHGKY